MSLFSLHTTKTFATSGSSSKHTFSLVLDQNIFSFWCTKFLATETHLFAISHQEGSTIWVMQAWFSVSCARIFWQGRCKTTVKSDWYIPPATPAAAFSLHTCPSTSELTPQSSTKDLWVELLLVFTNFWTVALWADICWVNIDNRTLPCILSPDRLGFCTRCWKRRHVES